MTRVLTCLGMMSVLLLTFTVSSGLVSHKAYARGDLDPLGTKIRESISNQITEELSGSAGPNPSSSSGSSGLTTSSPIATTLTFSVRPSSTIRGAYDATGTLKTDTGSPVVGAVITFTGTAQDGHALSLTNTRASTDNTGEYRAGILLDNPFERVAFFTAHYAGAPAIPATPGFLPSNSGAVAP